MSQQKNGPVSHYDTGRDTFTFDEGLLNQDVPFYFNENSITAASALIQHLSNHASPKICHAIKNGVPVGKVKQKVFKQNQVADIKRHDTKISFIEHRGAYFSSVTQFGPYKGPVWIDHET